MTRADEITIRILAARNRLGPADVVAEQFGVLEHEVQKLIDEINETVRLDNRRQPHRTAA